MTATLFFVVELESSLVTCSKHDAAHTLAKSARSSSRRNPTWRLTSLLTQSPRWDAASVELSSSAISISRITKNASTKWSLMSKLMINQLLSVARSSSLHRHRRRQQHPLLPPHTKVTLIRLHSIASCLKLWWAMHPMPPNNSNCFFKFFLSFFPSMLMMILFLLLLIVVIIILTFCYCCYQLLNY